MGEKTLSQTLKELYGINDAYLNSATAVVKEKLEKSSVADLENVETTFPVPDTGAPTVVSLNEIYVEIQRYKTYGDIGDFVYAVICKLSIPGGHGEGSQVIEHIAPEEVYYSGNLPPVFKNWKDARDYMIEKDEGATIKAIKLL